MKIKSPKTGKEYDYNEEEILSFFKKKEGNDLSKKLESIPKIFYILDNKNSLNNKHTIFYKLYYSENIHEFVMSVNVVSQETGEINTDFSKFDRIVSKVDVIMLLEDYISRSDSITQSEIFIKYVNDIEGDLVKELRKRNMLILDKASEKDEHMIIIANNKPIAITNNYNLIYRYNNMNDTTDHFNSASLSMSMIEENLDLIITREELKCLSNAKVLLASQDKMFKITSVIFEGQDILISMSNASETFDNTEIIKEIITDIDKGILPKIALSSYSSKLIGKEDSGVDKATMMGLLDGLF